MSNPQLQNQNVNSAGQGAMEVTPSWASRHSGGGYGGFADLNGMNGQAAPQIPVAPVATNDRISQAQTKAELEGWAPPQSLTDVFDRAVAPKKGPSISGTISGGEPVTIPLEPSKSDPHHTQAFLDRQKLPMGEFPQTMNRGPTDKNFYVADELVKPMAAAMTGLDNYDENLRTEIAAENARFAAKNPKAAPVAAPTEVSPALAKTPASLMDRFSEGNPAMPAQQIAPPIPPEASADEAAPHIQKGIDFMLENIEGATPFKEPKGGVTKYGIGVGNSDGMQVNNIEEARAAFNEKYLNTPALKSVMNSAKTPQDAAAFAQLVIHAPAWAAQFAKTYKPGVGSLTQDVLNFQSKKAEGWSGNNRAIVASRQAKVWKYNPS